MKGGLPGSSGHGLVCRAYVIHVRGQVFKNLAAVQVNVEINLGIKAVLKKMRDTVGRGALLAAWKNAVEVFVVSGHKRWIAGLEPGDIDRVYEDQASVYIFGVKLAGQLDSSLDADVFAAVDTAGDEDGFSITRAVDQGDGNLDFCVRDGQHALDFLAGGGGQCAD